MPGLTLAPAAAASVPTPRRCRVFVSYAHQDALKPDGQPMGKSLLDCFETQLKNLRLTLEARGCKLHDSEVFIDRQRLLETTRSQVDRLLDPSRDVTLSTLQRAAALVGRKLKVQLV